MKRISFTAIILLIAFTLCSALDTKTLGHIISIPVIDAAGIYSAVQLIRSDGVNGKAAGITSISLLAINGGLGAYTLFGKPENYAKFRTIHRIIGFAVTGAALWMSISAGTNDREQNSDKYITYGYSAVTTVPLVVFAF